MTSAFDSIGHSLGRLDATGGGASGPMGAPPPPPGGAGGGGKFTFQPDEIRAIIKDWLDLAQGYSESRIDARPLAMVTGPADEVASETYAKTASLSGRTYHDSLMQKRDYCYSQAQKFQNALHDYLGVDRKAVSRINDTGEDLPVAGPYTAGGI